MQKTAGKFYAVHNGRPFYNDLIKFMSSGPIVAAVLQKENAVTDYRTLIGATDPTKADVGTVRNLYANLLMQMQFMEAIVMIMQLLKHLSSFQI